MFPLVPCWLLVSVGASATPGVLALIEEAHQVGRLTEAERVFMRVAAVREPGLLPEPWRALPAVSPGSRRCVTDVMVQGFQSLRELPVALRGPVARMLAPPVDMAHVLETAEPFPVRVSYDDPVLAQKARDVMAAMVLSYRKEVQEWGFRAPPIPPGQTHYRVYVTSARGAAGYTSPYEEVGSTPQTDAYSYIVIDPGNDGAGLAGTVAHEFNHACQVAVDARELTAFMENTATYIESQVVPEDFTFTRYTFPFFQGAPHRPLEFMQLTGSDGYEYGGSLWAIHLVETYGQGDPRWIREVWDATAQEGAVNEPDYFDALEGKLGSRGGMREAVRAFARNRYYVGRDGDAHHLAGAAAWRGAEVARAATWSEANLPILDRAPAQTATRPQPNGCNYVVLGLSGYSPFPVRVGFRGDAEVDWSVDVLKVPAAHADDYVPLALDAEGWGQVSVAVDGLERLVMAICHLAPATYDPDSRAWTPAHYQYSLALDVPPPVVTAVTPSKLPRGSHGLEVTVSGEGFVSHDGLVVRLGGGRVALRDVEYLSATTLRARAYVAPSAELGSRDVVVVNPAMTEGVGAGIVEIVEAAVSAGEDPADEEGGDACACSAVPPGPGWLAVLAAALLALARGLRRGRGLVVVLVLLAGTQARAEVTVSVSQRYPLRVIHDGTVGDQAVSDVMGYAEESWESQVVGMGFRAPMTWDENGVEVNGLTIRLEPGGTHNYALSLADNPATPWTDCVVSVVVATLSPASYARTVVFHEMHHALQYATDCTEAPFAFEQTAVAVEVITNPDNPLFAQYFLPTFQQNPESGLDCTFFMDARRLQ